jgi:hypothetical protein
MFGGAVVTADFEAAVDQVLTIWSSRPSAVFKLSNLRKQTKNRWSRDDPSFLIVMSLLVFSAAVSHACVLAEGPLWGPWLWLVARIFFVEWLAVAAIASTAGWWIANTHLLQQSSHSIAQTVEWRYAFDVHCNAFCAFFVPYYVAQLALLPFLLGESTMALLAANAVQAVALGAYFYVTHLGCVEGAVLVLRPGPLVVVLGLLLVVLRPGCYYACCCCYCSAYFAALLPPN